MLIDGKALAQRVREETAREAAALPRKAGLAVVLVGDDPASRIYVSGKERDCEQCGFISREYKFDDTVTQKTLLELISALNRDAEIDGILVQLPLPEHIDEDAVIEAISPEKDVDAFHPVNVGRLSAGKPVLLPCTPAGIMEMLRAYEIPVEGKVCTVVGRSNIVGKPMAMMLLRANGTVISCHSRTPRLAEFTRQADILVVAAGHKGLITGEMIKPGAAVIDVGINWDDENQRLVGDVDFDAVEPIVSKITPVPRGVGSVTTAVLAKHVVEAAERTLA